MVAFDAVAGKPSPSPQSAVHRWVETPLYLVPAIDCRSLNLGLGVVPGSGHIFPRAGRRLHYRPELHAGDRLLLLMLSSRPGAALRLSVARAQSRTALGG
ncbi:hypothetical protein HPB50_008896 [Hyalomma asiaticum]|uniref:Uncharacterized protein n=1 Tax=Hyalomma asiaticum TaxID=266040 RepID=A0ACB7TF30_HYAAI|nr:hypothetical protein HPB50_008896 [Hyalomma asiaticum]